MLIHPIGALLLALPMLAAVPQPEPQSGPHYVQGCDPCTMVLHDGSTPVDFRFKLETVPEGRVVKSIVFERSGHTVQELAVPTMTPLAQDQQFFFGGQDINFDGWLDLAMMTEQGAANARAEYWVYDAVTDRFRDLGEFPIFRVDAAQKRLSTYVSNGPAGLGFEKRDYSFEGTDPIVVEEETQKPSASRQGSYVHTIRHRKGGKLVVVHREMVRQPATP